MVLLGAVLEDWDCGIWSYFWVDYVTIELHCRTCSRLRIACWLGELLPPTLEFGPEPIYLSKAPSPNTITLGIQAFTFELGGGGNTNIWSTVQARNTLAQMILCYKAFSAPLHGKIVMPFLCIQSPRYLPTAGTYSWFVYLLNCTTSGLLLS